MCLQLTVENSKQLYTQRNIKVLTVALCISVATLSELFCKSELISRFEVKRKTFLVPVLAKTKPRALLFADTLILGIFLMTRGMPSFSRRIPRLYYILKHFILNIDTSNLRLVNF